MAMKMMKSVPSLSSQENRKRLRKKYSAQGRRGHRAVAAATEQLETRLLFANIMSTGGGDWNDAATWVGMVVPGGSDNVTIGPGASVTVYDNISAGSLLTQQGSTLGIATRTDSHGTLHVGNLSVLNTSGGGNISNIGGAFNVAPTTSFAAPAGGAINATGTTHLQGTIVGGTLANFGDMTIDSGGGCYAGNLTNDGRITVGGSGILLGAGGTITNNPDGTFNLTNDSGFNPSTFNIVSSGTFINQGIFNKTGGTGTSNFPNYTDQTINELAKFENLGGTVNINSGTFSIHEDAYLRGGTINVAAGATLSFDGQNANPYFYTIGAADIVTGSGGGTIAFNAGTIKPVLPGGIGSDGTLNFPAGMVRVGNAEFDRYNTSNLTNTGFLNFAGSAGHGLVSMINQGTIINTGSSAIPAAFLTNDTAGLIDLQTDAGITLGGDGLTNLGILRKSVGAGVSIIDATNFRNNGGTIDIRTGTLSVRNSSTNIFVAGPLDIATGATLDFQSTGGFYLGGTLSSTGGGKVTFTTGTIQGLVTLDGTQGGTAPGVLNFAPNTFYDDGGIIAPGNTGITNTGTIYSQGDNRLNGMINQGTFFIDAGPFFFAGNVLNDTTGIINFTGDTASTQSGVLTNNGAIIKSGGSGTLNLENGGGQIVNHGTIEAAAGTLELNGGNQGLLSFTPLSELQVNAGETLKVDAGASLTLSTTINLTTISGTVILDGAGASFPGLSALKTVTGTGTLAVLSGATFTTAAALDNRGKVSVGGKLTVSGDFTESQDSSVTTLPTLDFPVAAAPGSAGAPAFSVTGNTTLAGNLTAEFSGGFGAAAGSSYTAATFNHSAGGAFASTAGVGPDFTVAVNPTTIVLNSTAQGTADLAATSVTAPASFTDGQLVPISWQVTNLGAGTTKSWVDSVYLSSDGTINPNDLLLGRVAHTGGLGASAGYTGTLNAAFPASAGSYKIVVLVDSGLVVADTNRLNNIGVSGATTPNYPILPLNGTVSGNIAAGQDVIYQLTLPGGSDVRVTATLPSPQLTDLEISRRQVPSPGSADFEVPLNATSGTLATTITQPQPGVYYIHLFGQPGAGAGAAFTLSAAAVAFAVFGVSPSTVGSGSNTLTVAGAGFGAGSTVKLVDSGGNVIATAGTVTARDPNTLLTAIDLTGVPSGVYGVRVTSNGNTTTLPAALTVQAATPLLGAVQFNFSVPPLVRFNHTYDIYVTYTNPNNVAVPAPFFELAGPNETFSLAAGSAGSNLVTTGNFSDYALDLLAINQNGTAGMLPANYTGEYDIQVKELVDLPHSSIETTLAVPDGSEQFDLSKVLQSGSNGISVLSGEILSAQVNGGTALPTAPTSGSVAGYTLNPNLNVSLSALTQHLITIADNLSNDGVYNPDFEGLLNTALGVADGFGAVTAREQVGAFGAGTPDPYQFQLVANASDGGFDLITSKGDQPFVPVNSTTFVGASSSAVGTLAYQTDGSLRLTEPDGGFFQFNSAMRLANYQTAGGLASTLGYNAAGQVTSYTDSNGMTSTFTYSSTSGGVIASETDAFGVTTTYGYQSVAGPAVAPGVTPAPTQLLTTVTSPAGTTTISYEPAPALTSVGGTSYLTTSPALEYLPASITLPDGSGTLFSYDGFGRIVKASLLDGSAPVVYSFDPSGLAVTTTFPDGTSSTESFGDGGELLKATGIDGQQTSYGYAANGVLTAILAPGGALSSQTTDSSGQVIANTSAAGSSIQFIHDANGHVVGLVNGNGNRVSVAYDANSNITAVTYPDGSAQQYAYNAQGKINQITSRGGAVTHIASNQAGEITQEMYGDGSSRTYTYNAHGDVVTATDASGTTTLTYDSADRLTSVTYPNGRSVSYVFDSLGRVSRKSNQSGVLENFSYDADSRISVITDGSGNNLVTYAYDQFGGISMEAFGNGTKEIYGYNHLGLISSIDELSPTGTITSSLTYAYDANGHPTSVTDQSGSVTAYSYDLSGELTSVVLPGGRTITYTYDAAGNRTAVTDSGVTTNYTTNNLDQYTAVGSTTYTYNADGDLARTTDSTGTTTYTYDDNGYLHSSTGPGGTFVYTFDALGNLSSFTKNGVRTDLLTDAAGSIIAAYDASGNLIDSYQYGIALISQQSGAGAAAYYNSDLAGNVVSTTDSTGATVNTYSYLPFGTKLSSTGPAGGLFTYSGANGVLDLGDGFYQARARTYSPQTGHFLQPDPAAQAVGVNLYEYADNNPVIESDPSGLHGEKTGEGSPASGSEPAAEKPVNNLDAISHPPITYGIATEAEVGPFGLGLKIQASDSNVYVTFERSTGIGGGAYLIFGARIPESGGTGPRTGENTAGAIVANTTDAEGRVVSNNFGAFAGSSSTVGSYTINGREFANGALKFADGALTIAGGAINGLQHAAGSAGDYVFSAPLPTTPETPYQGNFRKRHPKFKGPVLNPGTIIGRKLGQAVNAVDPNEIVGPGGSGSALYTTGARKLPYTIFFENQPKASAPAQTVVVTTVLDPNVDLSTFELTSLGWGAETLSVPAGLSSYSTRVSYVQPDTGKTILVDVSAALNVSTRTLTWTLKTLDPTTLDTPSDPLAGFLPPDDASGRGTGFVGYTVRPNAGLATGATISAAASIVFDSNAAIATKTWTNTIDAVAPASSVAAIAASQTSVNFPVSWSGSDDANGSGIASYAIYVSTDGGTFTPWLTTAATSAQYVGSPGHVYAFYSTATDNAGNLEPTPSAAQAQTAVPVADRFVTFGGKTKGTYTDAAGNLVTVTLTGPGTGTLAFIGSGSADPVSVVVTGTTARSVLTVRAAKGTTTLTGVEITGSLANFSAKSANLTGGFDITGTLGAMTLNNVNNGPATITVEGSGASTFTFGILQDFSLTTAGTIKSLSATSWTDGAFASDALTAAALGKLSIKGAFDANMSLTNGALSATLGSITGGTWGAGGSVQTLTTGTVASGWSATVTGNVGSITIRGDIDGSLMAQSIRSLRVIGNLNGSTITLTGTAATLGRTAALGSFNVTGNVDNSTISVAGNIGAVSVGGMSGSDLFAGVTARTTGLPTAGALSNASILSFTAGGKSPFANSNVAAKAIGAVTLHNVTTDNGGTPFGVATTSLKSFALLQPKQRPVLWHAKQSTAVFNSLPGDLKVQEP